MDPSPPRLALTTDPRPSGHLATVVLGLVLVLVLGWSVSACPKTRPTDVDTGSFQGSRGAGLATPKSGSKAGSKAGSKSGSKSGVDPPATGRVHAGAQATITGATLTLAAQLPGGLADRVAYIPTPPGVGAGGGDRWAAAGWGGLRTFRGLEPERLDASRPPGAASGTDADKRKAAVRGGFHSLVASRDGAWLFAGTLALDATTWRSRALPNLREVIGRSTAYAGGYEPHAAAWGPLGQVLVVGLYYRPGRALHASSRRLPERVVAVDGHSGKAQAELSGGSDGPLAVGRHRVATTTMGSTLRLYRRDGWALEAELGRAVSWVRRMRFSPDDASLAGVTGRGEAFLLAGPEPPGEASTPPMSLAVLWRAHAGYAEALAWHPTLPVLATAAEGGGAAAEGGDAGRGAGAAGGGERDGVAQAVGRPAGELCLWDLMARPPRRLARVLLPATQEKGIRPSDVAFLGDGRRLVVASGQHLLVYDVALDVALTVEPPKHPAPPSRGR